MRDVIEKHMGFAYSTEGGKKFLLKALHPADVGNCDGVPDRCSVPTVNMAYQSEITVSAPTNADANTVWSFDGALIPHPVCPLSGRRTAVVSGTPTVTFDVKMLNPTLDPTFTTSTANTMTHGPRYQLFKGMVERWRLTYQSATVTLNAPSTASQGMVFAAQVPVESTAFNVTMPELNPGAVGLAPTQEKLGVLKETKGKKAFVCESDEQEPDEESLGTVSTGYDISSSKSYMDNFTRVVVMPHLYRYLPIDHYPEYTRFANLPNSYAAEAVDGLYMPLHLTETSQKWTSSMNEGFFGVSAYDYAMPQYSGATETNSVGFSVPTSPADQFLNGTVMQPFFPDLQPLVRVYNIGTTDSHGRTVQPDVARWTGDMAGEVTSPLLNSLVGFFSFRGLSTQASLTIRVRWGIEAQCPMNSVLIPQLRPPLPYDATALTAYYAIARELKDAYPESYNSWGKLLDVILAGARSAKSIIQGIPVGGGLINGAVEGLSKLREIYKRDEPTKKEIKQEIQKEVKKEESKKKYPPRRNRNKAPKQGPPVPPRP